MSSFIGSKSSQQKAIHGGKRPDAPAGLGEVMVMFDRNGTTKFTVTNKKTDANDQPLLDNDGNQIEVVIPMYRCIITGHGPCVIKTVDGEMLDVAANQFVGSAARLKIRSTDTMIEENVAAGILPGAHDGSMEAHLDQMVEEQFVPFMVYSPESYGKWNKEARTEERVVYKPGTLHVSPNQ